MRIRQSTNSRLTAAVLTVVVAAISVTARAEIPSETLLKQLKSTGFVNDFAQILPPAQREALEGRLKALEQKTSAQFTVVILKSLEGGEIDDFGYKLFKKWSVGQKGKNNGALLLVAIEDRRARVEVGYGLEPILPDILSGRVLREQLVPAFRQQHYAEGVTQAADHIAAIIERGEPATAADRRAALPWNGRNTTTRSGPSSPFRGSFRPASLPTCGASRIRPTPFTSRQPARPRKRRK